MRKKEKGKSGAVTNYVTRNQALKQLRLTLIDFRRLCILKGIYPREPNNLKKVSKGNTAPKTYYWAKDIQFLAHEPLLKRFRDFKVFAKRLRKALGKKEHSLIPKLKKNKPIYNLDHLIRERYPSFVDAVRDLDDALCMVSLFARMPSTKNVFSRTVEACHRLVSEFHQYCIQTSAIRKVFLSIKGVYYQAEIYGQPVTWIAPYHLSQKVPSDVDFRTMFTFLEFYETLLGFVNFKLYHDQGLRYPPVLNQNLHNSDAGINAFALKPVTENSSLAIAQAHASTEQMSEVDQKAQDESVKRIATLQAKMTSLTKHDDEETKKESTTATKSDVSLDEFPENKAIAESSNEVGLADLREKDKQLRIFKGLFSGLVFFLARESPRDSLVFLIRCFGGQVGWEAGSGSPFTAEDESITHHIADRDNVKHRFIGREYIQPQWVYDSINFQRLVATKDYALGAPPPPHFSPFVVEQEGDYVPRELRLMRGETVAALDKSEATGKAKKQLQKKDKVERVEKDDDEEEETEEGDDGEEVEEGEEDDEEEEEEEEGEEEDEDEDDEDEEDDEEEMEAIDSDDEEAIYKKELEAEAAGIPFSEFESKMRKVGKPKVKASEIRKIQEEKEHKDLAKTMMKKKDKRLYTKITAAQNRKKHYVERMENKRKVIDEAKSEQSEKKRRVK